MFTLNIVRASKTETFEIDDFTISKTVTDPSNVENGRFIARMYNISNPTDLFYLTDITDIEKIELLKDEENIFSSTNFISPKEVRGYYEMAIGAMATELHLEAVNE